MRTEWWEIHTNLSVLNIINLSSVLLAFFARCAVSTYEVLIIILPKMSIVSMSTNNPVKA